jgi:hypothetical protein
LPTARFRSNSLGAQQAAAQAASESLLRTVLTRGKLIVGTGSTKPSALKEIDNQAGSTLFVRPGSFGFAA